MTITKKCPHCKQIIKSYYVFRSEKIPEIRYRQYSCVTCQIMITEIINKKARDKYKDLYPFQYTN